jgi:hypothetical protein
VVEAVTAPVVAAAAATTTAVKGATPFVLGAFGKQRRSYEWIPAAGAAAGLASYCDPILGLKAGLAFGLAPHFILAPSVGVAVNFDEGDRTALFAEVEADYVADNGVLVGAGLGISDIFDGDSRVPHLLATFAVPVSKTRTSTGLPRASFATEGRIFFEDGGVDNNYQFWAGLRFNFK